MATLAGCGPLGLERGGEEADATSSEADASDAKADADGARVAATLGGTEISVSDIDDFITKSFLEQLRSQPPAELFDARNKAIQEMVQKRAIEIAAEERGVSTDELFEQVTNDVAPASVEDVTKWYAENQAKLRGARLEDISSQIQQLLTKERQTEAWAGFMAPKLEALDFQMILEPPRQNLEATRLVRGRVDAPVTIMAFSDYQCPYCVRSEPMLAEVLSRYPDQVRIVHRHFPLDSIHPFARPAAEASMCADEQGKFWEFHDAIFARNGKLSAGSFAEIGSELGLDGDALGSCMSEKRYADFVQQDFEAGRAAGVTGTPAFFVNGVALKGSRDADELSKIVDSELARVQVN